MESFRIIALAIFAAIAYGVAHDQVTARICVEYFTIGHPPLFPTQSPTLLALGWGVVATWWVGLPLGILLAVASRAGQRSKLKWVDLRRPILRLLLMMASCAFVAGVVGGVLARQHDIWMIGPLATRVPKDRQELFLIDLWAHSASYAAGIIGGLVLATWTWRHRANRVTIDAPVEPDRSVLPGPTVA